MMRLNSAGCGPGDLDCLVRILNKMAESPEAGMLLLEDFMYGVTRVVFNPCPGMAPCRVESVEIVERDTHGAPTRVRFRVAGTTYEAIPVGDGSTLVIYPRGGGD